MKIAAIRTDKITPGSENIYGVLDRFVPHLEEKEILVITSKVVALCENQVISPISGDKEELVARESGAYFPRQLGSQTFYLSITHHTLLMTAGIDNSNGNGQLVLLPKDPQASANAIRQYLVKRFGLQHIGVIITDSTSQLLRRGTIGVGLAHSGFSAINDYRGKPDVFGKPLKVSRSNIAAGLAAAAVTVMGEGAEQTPLSVISDIPLVVFQARDPTKEELDDLYVPQEEDLFAPLLTALPWKPGERA